MSLFPKFFMKLYNSVADVNFYDHLIISSNMAVLKFQAKIQNTYV